VNYFGHAAVASWYSPEPAAALGAMLPDFATMSGTRLAEATDPAIARGIALHHKTDGAFHHLPPVLALMRELDDRLEAGGCARGPRRAVAHIGIELLIDGVLVAETPYRDLYVAALAYDTSGIQFREADDRPRFATLHTRLLGYGVPDDLARPESIVHRLQRMLAHRPLLAPNATDLAVIKTSLVEQKPRVDVATEAVLRSLRATMPA
jgi:acyl carrier protein phosphodiesterase